MTATVVESSFDGDMTFANSKGEHKHDDKADTEGRPKKKVTWQDASVSETESQVKSQISSSGDERDSSIEIDSTYKKMAQHKGKDIKPI